MSDTSFPYHEPSIETLLILTSFILLLNIVNYLFDKLIYCGLLGQILIGIWFGVPGTAWLSADVQLAIQQLGYLGLILIVYEGGLNTSMKTVKANLLLSSLVALIGIGAPIALSFVLQGLLEIGPIQAFGAGAALCSTSLGTTFTVLSSSGLTESRLGVVLTSAAMMDDVVGLVMVKVISTLGTSSGKFDEITVIRPVFVSLAFAILTPLICAKLIAPLLRTFGHENSALKRSLFFKRLPSRHVRFTMHTLILIGLVVGATYAGTSGLFAAYIAGASITWLEDQVMTPRASNGADANRCSSGQQQNDKQERGLGGAVDVATQPDSTQDAQQAASPSRVAQKEQTSKLRSLDIYERYFKPALDTILKPFFFASIGFSIPITEMFSGSIVWRGFVYAALMAFGKLLCGIWLVRGPSMGSKATQMRRLLTSVQASRCWPAMLNSKHQKPSPAQDVARSSQSRSDTAADPAVHNKAVETARVPDTTNRQQSSLSHQPLSLYPSAILGGAMIARGEIGFLISSIAKTSGIFTNDLFLVVTWAIFLCTFAGPLLVGLLVRRVKALQCNERERATGKEDPLGIWGVA